MKEIKKVGIVAMPIISVGGGFPRVTRDLIATLNSMGKEVYLTSPFKVDIKKIEELYGPIKIKKSFYPNQRFSYLYREETLGRKLIKKQFKKMATEVDFIIDLDGTALHKYLPKEFNNDNYVIWRLSCINPETHKIQKFTNSKILIKKTVKKFLLRNSDIPHDVKIYPVDEWTKKELIDFWMVKPQEMCLYPEIKVEELDPTKRKEDQIVILGRIAPNKEIHTSVKIFAEGTKKFPNYSLAIIGGSTPDTEKYLAELKEIIEDLQIEKRVKITLDASFNEIKRILSYSKIILDSQIGTSLNMPVIEAMASGCIAIMRKYSGTFDEVLEKGKYGHGFETIEEGAKTLENLLSQKKLDNKKSIERAQFFSSAKFKKRVETILSE